MSKVDEVNDAGTMSGDDDDDLPDDFFDELGDSQFINKLEANDSFDEFLTQNDSRENSPEMARRLAEIAILTENIKRRKKKLEEDLSKKGLTSETLQKELLEADKNFEREKNSREKHSRDRASREKRRHKNRSPSYHRHRRSRSMEKKSHRHRKRSRSNSPRRRANRSRSRSPRNQRSASTHKNLTFLEELAQTFAEKGQAFPEKDFLLNSATAVNTTATTTSNQVPFNPHVPIEYPNPNIMHYPQTTPHVNPMIYQQPQQPFAGPHMAYYGINPMVVPGVPSSSIPVQPIPPPLPDRSVEVQFPKNLIKESAQE